MSNPVNHHYVAQHVLRRFCDANGVLWTYDKEKNKIYPGRPRDQASGKHFYSFKGRDGTKTRWEYIASAGVLRVILPQILPYMIVKKAHAEKMMEYFRFIDTHPLWGLKQVDPRYYEKLDLIYATLKKLNRKGRGKIRT